MKRALTAAPMLAVLLMPAAVWAHDPDEACGQTPCPMADRAAADEREDTEPHPEGRMRPPDGRPPRRGHGEHRCQDDACDREGGDADEVWRDGGWEPGHGLRFVPSAQYRLRFRHEEGRDFEPGEPIRDYFRHRVRAGLQGMWQGKLGVFLQVQDARTYGEESSTADGQANAFDLHQGYAILVPTRGLELRLGRQEIAYENERLVGRSGWGEEGRSFDGVRVSFDKGGLHADAFYARLREVASPNATPDVLAAFSGKAHFVGFDIRHHPLPELSPAVMGTVDLDDVTGKRHMTLGILIDGDIAGGSATYGLEGYYQFGRTTVDAPHSAFMLGLHARGTLPVTAKPYLEAFANFSSGDGDPTDLVDGVFSTGQGTAHRFYGDVDMFLDLPRDTQGRGLREVGAVLGCSPVEGMAIRSRFHFFQAMASRPDSLMTFGEELDNTIEYRFWEHATVDFGYSFFVPEALKQLGRADAVLEHFVYSTVELSL